jgi:hypothetical protein
MTNEIEVKQDAQLMESVLLQGDLSKLNPSQRVNYYQKVCQSIGLNPLTRPFDYINLNGKLTLYAKKDAADQLRNLHGVSIDDVDIIETATQFIVKVKGHNKDGRTDVEVGVVNKTDMQGNLANAQMKAVTKGKRRLTLSLCGLGWLDETEVQTIPDARPVAVDTETGEIVDAEKKTKPVKEPEDQTPDEERPYLPDVFRQRFNTLTNALRGKYKELKVTDGERKVLASAIDGVFNGDKTMRYEFTKWLTGTSSTKELNPYHVRALMTVMEVKSFDDAPNDYSMTEIRSAHAEALREMGQEEFPFDAPPAQ